MNDPKLFELFKEKMLKEYYRHYKQHGDSWKDCDPEHLFGLLNDAINRHDTKELKQNPEHFIDIANFSLFCYYRFKELKGRS